MRTTFRLRAGAEVCTRPDGTTHLTSRTTTQSFGTLTERQRAVLEALAHGCDDQEFFAAEHELVTMEEFSGVCSLLARLRQGNWLAATLVNGDEPLLTVHPTGGGVAGNLTSLLATVRPAQGIVLSRFAILRRDGEVLVLESPRSGFTVHLHDLRLLSMNDAQVCGLLVALSLAVRSGDREDCAWAPHELWFHARSRRGRHENPWGVTLRSSPPPAKHGKRAGIPLPAADTPRTMSLTAAVESRRSLREHDDLAPLTVSELGEFLFRTARTRNTWTWSATELLDRPYPSAGALHELEIYPVVSTVTGVPRGLYHYDSHEHQLVPLDAGEASVGCLLGDAAQALRTDREPQVLFVITARFERVMWKYESMAYALTLKNVGALMSVMYLVATAMRLAPCALGGGDADLFAEAAGLAYESESSVGEFVLGSAPPNRKEQT